MDVGASVAVCRGSITLRMVDVALHSLVLLNNDAVFYDY